ncbi:MAG: ankyrin repeat domain-containing protein [Alphaproteobacteria bacterium]|nr:ankyrin repeat domain-containing protein [Alphaproteobacteria bacterium]
MLKIVLAVLLLTTPLANAQNVWGDEKETAVENFAENMEEKVGTWQVQDVEKLHDEGFDFNKKDAKGNTVLYYALSRNLSADVAKKIIEYGADVNEPAANGMLPLNVATSKANEMQLQVLMMKTMGLDMANPKIEAELEKNIFHEMRRMTELAAVLIDAGADVNKESVLGTPLMNAVTNRWNEEIIDLLLKYGADVNAQDKNGRTALFYAFSSGNDDLVSLLIQAGANTELKDKDGKTYMELERTEIRQ